MGELVELLEQLAEKGKLTAEYIVPDEHEILAGRVQKETRPVTTYRLSEAERQALVEEYGPPMPAEKAEKIRQRLRAAHWMNDEKKKEE